jgi:hypothetical protein
MPLSDAIETLNRGIQHPNPLHDYLTTFVPRKLKTLFTYCEYLFYNSPQIFAALTKFSVYPVTDLIYETSSPKLKKKYKNLLENTLNLRGILTKTGIDRHVYGNSFTSIYFPFKRFLQCTHCKSKYNIKNVSFKFSMKRKSANFYFTCKNCGRSHVKAKVEDQQLSYPAGINVIRWDPKHIEIESNPITGEAQYYYNIPESIKSRIYKGDRHLLTTIPLAFIDTVAKKKLFKFAPGKIYHMKADAPSGLDDRWGFPPLTSTIKQFFYVAVLRKANESISLEHIVPFRVLSPKQASATGDPTMTISLTNWINEMKTNYRAWRKDPLHMMFAPIPVEVTNIGGQGRALMVTGEIVEAENAIIASMGIPREFLYGGLSATGSGVTLRMLENQLLNYTNQLIAQAQWISDQCGQYLGWKKIKVDLEPFKLVDDVQQKSMLIEANQAAGGQILSITSLASIMGRDLAKERELRKQEILDEHRFQYELQKEVAEQDQSMSDRARAAATTEQPQGYDQQQMVAQADLLVEQLSGMDESARRSAFHQLQTEDIVMYSLLKVRWEAMQTTQQAAMRSQMTDDPAAQGGPQ